VKERAGRARPPLDVRAALRGEIEQALALLARAPLADPSIHAFRQTLKRARAALRLLRAAVPTAAYAAENAQLRDAARPLAQVRDAAVLLELLDELLGSRKMRGHRATLARLRTRLRRSHARLLAAARAARVKAGMQRRLEQSLGRTSGWRLPRDPLPVYVSGLKRLYRKGRNGLDRALTPGSAAALHEWRKQVKYLGAALALVAPALPRGAKRRKAADEIARRLGDDHDLAMLARALRRADADRALVSKLEDRRRKLQKRARKLARRLYQRPPARFASGLQKIRPGRSSA